MSEVREDQTVRVKLRPFIEQHVIEAKIQDVAARSVTYKNSNVFMATAEVPRVFRAKNSEPKMTEAVNAPDNPGEKLVLQPGMTGKAKIVLPEDTTYASIYARMIYRKVAYWMF